MPVVAYLGLGANLGDPRATIDRAIGVLASLGKIDRARMYSSRPLAGGPAGQPDSFNTAVKVETELSARELLSFVKRLEAELGRVAGEHWGARAIDIDILMYGDAVIASDDLVIPHAEMARRRFVLAPLAELAGEVVVPGIGRTVREMFAALGEDPDDTWLV
jgi:2-amino-4-hydroxy-6-hydroxymethyldihydropteridine diphosphokinase